MFNEDEKNKGSSEREGLKGVRLLAEIPQAGEMPIVNKEGLRIIRERNLCIPSGFDGKICGVEFITPGTAMDLLLLSRQLGGIGKKEILERLMYPVRARNAGYPNLFRGDVILNLQTGEAFKVEDKQGKVVFSDSEATRGEFIVIRNCLEEVPTVRITEESTLEETTTRLGEHFLPDLSVIPYPDIALGKMNIEVTVEMGGEKTTHIARGEPEKEALTAMKLADGEIVFPNFPHGAKIFIVAPERLAAFIYRNRLVGRFEEVENIGLAVIGWWLTREAIQGVLERYAYRDIFSPPSQKEPYYNPPFSREKILAYTPRPEIQGELLRAVRRELAKVGLMLTGTREENLEIRLHGVEAFCGGGFRRYEIYEWYQDKPTQEELRRWEEETPLQTIKRWSENLIMKGATAEYRKRIAYWEEISKAIDELSGERALLRTQQAHSKNSLTPQTS